MFTRIAHICINTRDLARSISYYTKLGFTVQFKFTRKGADFGAYLNISPGNYIEIFENKKLEQVVNNGITHFCLETDDIDALIGRLQRLDIGFSPKKFGCDNTWQLWLTDPDGNQFEVHQYGDTSRQLTGDGPVEADW
jgi:catechol 2,3-dioxygenase-like lactoylglutathione lyase family enzyme